MNYNYKSERSERSREEQALRKVSQASRSECAGESDVEWKGEVDDPCEMRGSAV